MSWPETRPPRVEYRVPVAILCSEARLRLSGRTRNVSEGGMFVESARLLPVGTAVRCGMALAQRPVELFGRVAWARPGPVEMGRGMGIQFLALERDTGLLLRVLVNAAATPEVVGEGQAEQTERIRRSPGRAALALLFVTVAAVAAAGVLAVLGARGGDQPRPPRAAPGVSARSMPSPSASPPPSAPPSQSPSAIASPNLSLTPKPNPTPTASDTPKATTASSATDPLRLVARPGAVVVSLASDEPVAVARHYPLASPDGIAVVLERGRARLAPGRHPVSADLVRMVQVSPDGRTVRVFTTGPVRYQVAPAESGSALQITIEQPGPAAVDAPPLPGAPQLPGATPLSR